MLDLLSHVVGTVFDYLGQAGSRHAWWWLLGSILVLAVAWTVVVSIPR